MSKQLKEKKAKIEQKLDELVKLLNDADLDSNTAHLYKQRIDEAIEKNIQTKEQISMYRRLDDTDMSRMEMLNELGRLLNTTQLDSYTIKQYKKKGLASSIVALAIGITLIALGFAMIILPAPADFEIYTLFYINANDGVTIMDLISLLIVLTGVFVVITALKRNKDDRGTI